MRRSDIIATMIVLLFIVVCVMATIYKSKINRQEDFFIDTNICDSIDYDDINQADWKSNNKWYNNNIK